MDKASKHQIVLRTILNQDQILIHNLFTACGVRIDAKTLIAIFKLVDLGIPPYSICSLLNETSKQVQRETKLRKL